LDKSYHIIIKFFIILLSLIYEELNYFLNKQHYQK